MIEKTARVVEERTHSTGLGVKALRYLFPDHWSFLLGEIALYAFIVLVGTGFYLALFFDPSTTQVVYHGSYGPLDGARMSEAYRSTQSFTDWMRRSRCERLPGGKTASAETGRRRPAVRGA